MTATELLEALRRRGVEVRLDGEELRVRAPKGALSAELREALVALKPDLLDLLRSAAHDSGVVRLRDGTGSPLFCLAGVGIYGHLARRLPSPVYGAFLPEEEAAVARDGVGGPTLASMAEGYADMVESTVARGPVALGGLSFGGMLAFECARVLRRRGREVSHVVLLDSILPNAIQRVRTAWLKAKAKAVLDRARAGDVVQTVHDVSAWLARRREGASEAHDPREHFYQSALAAHRFEPLAIDVVLVRSLDLEAELSSAGFHIDPARGWRDYVLGRLHVVAARGSHLSILEPPNVDALGRALSDHLCTPLSA